MPDSAIEPVGGLAFKVEIDGVTVGRFSECSGLSVEIEVTEHQEGGLNDFVHKLPGPMKYPNLVLKRGITEEEALLEWLLKLEQESARPKVTIDLMGPGGRRVRSWSFAAALPVKWEGPTLNAGANDLATETLEIAHQGMVR
ncbi:MAG TPA: phage tail protein [Solirubrobacterales bacterium]|nr:phage tail protein [Solirubrobacterales bacterium]